MGEDAASLGDHDWFQNIYDFESEWSRSANHAPQRIVFSPVYELPFGRGKRFNLSGVADTILGGWQISGIYTFLEDLKFHDLRRSAVRNMLVAGMDESKVMRIVGHKTRAMIDRYRIVSLKDDRQ